MNPKEFYESIPNGRCKPCRYGKVVFAENNYMFIGCYCKPFSGKRVAEIKDCPLYKIDEEDFRYS